MKVPHQTLAKRANCFSFFLSFFFFFFFFFFFRQLSSTLPQSVTMVFARNSSIFNRAVQRPIAFSLPPSKETRGMIEHNSEVYNPPYISFFIVHVYMEEDLCRGDCILHCYVRSSLLFPYFLPFWYPYILIHF